MNYILIDWWKKLRSIVEHFVLFWYYTGREFYRDQCSTRAAALTYFTLLSLIPLLVIIFVFVKNFGGDTLIEGTVKPIIFKVLSTGSGEAVSQSIDELIQRTSSGTIGTIGFIFLLLAAFSLIQQMEFTINAIWAEKKARPLFQRLVFYWATLTIIPLLVGLSLSATAKMSAFPQVQEIPRQFLQHIYRLLPLFLQGAAFFLIYKYMPRTKVRAIPAIAGAIVAAIFWELLKRTYLFYTTNALDYNLIYGSLAALPLFMIWLFISWMALLIGAEISFVLQNYRIINESRKTVLAPVQFYEALGLEILLETTKCFLQGGKPFNPIEFAHRRKLPQYLISATVDKLVASGVVVYVDRDIVLARDPEALTVEDALEAIRSGGTIEPPFGREGELKRLRQFLAELETSSQAKKREWSLKRMLQTTLDI
jgi:membrane protein